MKLKNKKNIVLFIAILIISIIFGYMYVYNEDNVYVYDYIGYQARLNIISDVFKNNILEGIHNLITSIRHEDYNYFPILFLVPMRILFGNSRLVYILSMICIYYVPIVFILTKTLLKKLELEDSKENILKITILIFIFCFSNFWAGMLRGLPDIIGLIPMLILFMNLESYDKDIKIRKLIFNGVLIYLPFLCRRWYAYSMVSHYFAIFIISLFDKKRITKKKIIKIIKNIFISGFTTSICVLLIQTPLFMKILNAQYNEAYSAYQIGLSRHFINFFNEYGLQIILLTLFGIIGSLKNKKNLKIILYCITNIIIFSLLFTRVQGMGVHHYLGISLFICILSIIGIYNIYSIFQKKIYKNIFLIFIIVLTILNFNTTFIFRNKSIPLISQNNKYYKFRYENYDELVKFRDDLSNLISTNYGKVSFFASSGNISDSLIETLGTDILKQNIYYTSNVDLRDGLNYNSLLYKYVVITSTPEVGTNIEKQQVLVYPNNLIYNNKGIGTNYKKILGPYILQDNVEVYVYEKIDSHAEKNITDYLEYFYKLYPNWKNEISDFDKLILSSKIEYGDFLGDFRKLDSNTFYIHPGYTPTKVNIKFQNKDYQKLKFNFYLDSNVPEIAKAKIIIYNNNKKILDEDLRSKENKKIEILLKDKNDISIIIEYGEEFAYDLVYMDYELS